MNIPDTPSDYYIGWITSLANFELSYSELLEIINLVNDDLVNTSVNEVCLIGLVSYTEAFFKNQFAALINIHNPLVLNLIKNKREVNIDVSDIIRLGSDINVQLGSLVSEQFDFGTANNINSLFNHLLKITPFSKDEIPKYNDILRDRNLIVHHGGIYTNKYIKQNKMYGDNIRVYADSISISKKQYLEIAEFIYYIVRKTVYISQRSLKKFLRENNVSLNHQQESAIENMIVSILKAITEDQKEWK